MTDAEKLSMVKTFLGITDNTQDATLQVYLSAAQKEIISWHYGNDTTVTVVPAEYEITQVQAVVTGFNLIGAENEKVHNENGINRTFSYTDMLQYIRSQVIPYARVL